MGAIFRTPELDDAATAHTITEGLWRLPAEVYHADPVVAPSLSSSVASLLLDASPRHAWAAHPRLGGATRDEDVEDKPDRATDLGSVAHALLLGKGRDIEVIEARDWRTTAAKEAREAAIAAERLPVLRPMYEQAGRMVDAARAQLCAIDEVWPLSDYEPESVVVWKETGGIWCRGMMDLVRIGERGERTVVIDYKTTAASAAPEDASRRLWGLGYHVQAAAYIRGVSAVTGVPEDAIDHLIIWQETAPPYALSVTRLDAGGRVIGRKKWAAAVELWAVCLERSQWPGYPARVVTAEMPSWVEQRWLDREIAFDEIGVSAFDMLNRWSPPPQTTREHTEPV